MRMLGLFALITLLATTAAYAGIPGFEILGGACGGGDIFNATCSTSPNQGLFSAISCRVINSFNTAVIPLYCNITGNPEYIQSINAILSLYIIIWGFSYLAGLVQGNLGATLTKLIKVLFVYVLVTDSGFYFDMVYKTAIETPREITSILLTAKGHSGDFFEYVDQGMFKAINNIFYPPLISDDPSGGSAKPGDLRILYVATAVAALAPGGNVIAGIFMLTIGGWLFAYVSIVIRYLLALLAMNFLLVLGPLFIPTILFEKTKHICGEWIQMIISFMIQIVITIAFILLVENFFLDFAKLLELGANKVAATQDFQEFVRPYSEDVVKIEKTYGVTYNGAKDYVESLGATDENGKKLEDREFIGWFVTQTAIMLVITMFTVQFMQIGVPAIAGGLTSNTRFSNVFASMGTTEFTGNRANQAPGMFSPFNRNKGGGGEAKGDYTNE